MTTPRKRKASFVGLFAGCGGFDLGFEKAGFRSIGAFDIDSSAVETYNANLCGRAEVCDLSALSSLTLGSRPDVVVAGPPCQGFSTLGRRSENDPRNSLLTTAARLAIGSGAKVVLLENVSGVVAGAHRIYWDHAREMFQTAGFQTREFRILGTDFGLPQIRKRIILLAARGSLGAIEQPPRLDNITLGRFLSALDRLPNHTPRVLAPGTAEFRIAQRIQPFQKLCNVRGGQRAVATWDIPEVFGPTTDRRLRSFGDADPLTLNDLQSSCKFDPSHMLRKLEGKGYLRRIGQRFDLVHTFNGKYRRLSWDHPAPTVDTRFGQPRYFLHPDEHRGLSAREAARIQGFPDEFVFHGSLSTQFRLIGNAVPPPIGTWFARMILEHIL